MEWRFESAESIYPSMMRQELLAELHRCGTPDSDYAAAELIFGELVSNLIRHARGSVCVRLDWSDEFPTLCVQDAGPNVKHDFALPPDPLAESGRGLYIVKALARDFVLKGDDGRDGSSACATLPVRRRD